MRYWTHYWKNETVDNQALLIDMGQIDDSLSHIAAGEMFAKRGTAPGDVVYVVTQTKGHVFLIGRLVVESITDQQEAETLLEQKLWDASEHIIAKRPWGQCHFDLEIPADKLSEVEFITPDGSLVGLAYNKYGSVDQQTLRTLRELTPKTAALLDELL